MPSLSTAISKILPGGKKRDSLRKEKDGPSRASVDSSAAKEEEIKLKEEEKLKKREKELEDERRVKMKRAQSSQVAQMNETPDQRVRYGEIEYDDPEDGEDKILISSITKDMIGKTVHLRVRLHTVRSVSVALVFLVLRQQTHTIQGVLSTSDVTTGHMVRWASRLQEETILHVKGTVQAPNVKDGQVHGTTVHDAELLLEEVHVISRVAEPVPFSVYEADISAQASAEDEEGKFKVSDRARLASRILHLRTTAAQGVFRVQSTVANAFRRYLEENDFIEIHTPKLQGGASESGASVFKFKYFGRLGFLAQSPQLPKQMSIAADFERVYEIGPVFRAENSNTHRHLTEYTGLDLEMAIQKDYHEVLRTVDGALKAIFEAVYATRRKEIDTIKTQFPHEDLVWLPETLVMPFADGIQILIDSGWTDDEGNPPKKDEDLSTRAEIRLGQLVKDKYKTDYYILDKFPRSARPFYTMPDRTNPSTTNSFDIFLRGQEITTGGQRIHQFDALMASMAANDISERGLEEYLDGFRWGAPPHGGAGIGLERLVMLLCGLGDIRYASMYPRDPKSLPEPVKGLEVLPHPEASTLPLSSKESQQRVKCICTVRGINPSSTASLDALSSTSLPLSPDASTPNGIGALTNGNANPNGITSALEQRLHRQLPPLPHLIANYGDAANTSWLDDRYQVWRDSLTGAAIGFVPSSHGFAIVVGDPLCDRGQFAGVTGRFLLWLRGRGKDEHKDKEHKDKEHLGKDGRNDNGFLDDKGVSAQGQGQGQVDKHHEHALGPLKPVWILVSKPMEEVLGARMGWSSFTCVAESRVELGGEVPAALAEKEVAKKMRSGESKGVEVLTYLGRDSGADEEKGMPKEIREACNRRIEEWREGRTKKGGQVRLTEVEPWRDEVHRQYFISMAPKKRMGKEGDEEEDKEEEGNENEVKSPEVAKAEHGSEEKEVCALVVLAQLSPIHGWQVKYALDFHGSPSGSIELALSAAMQAVASTGSGRLTFGTSATSRLTAVRNVGGMRVKMLSHAYEAISDKMRLHGKGEFRKKMGAEEDDVYICYPKGSLGTRGAKAVLDFCVAEA